MSDITSLGCFLHFRRNSPMRSHLQKYPAQQNPDLHKQKAHRFPRSTLVPLKPTLKPPALFHHFQYTVRLCSCPETKTTFPHLLAIVSIRFTIPLYLSFWVSVLETPPAGSYKHWPGILKWEREFSFGKDIRCLIETINFLHAPHWCKGDDE